MRFGPALDLPFLLAFPCRVLSWEIIALFGAHGLERAVSRVDF